MLLLYTPPQKSYAYVLAGLILGVYAVGMIRAWQLLGVRRYGLFGWLSPLRDLTEIGETPQDRARNP